MRVLVVFLPIISSLPIVAGAQALKQLPAWVVQHRFSDFLLNLAGDLEYLYTLTADDDDYNDRLWLSRDRGLTWRSLNPVVGVLNVFQSHRSSMIGGSLCGPVITTDGGHSWQRMFSEANDAAPLGGIARGDIGLALYGFGNPTPKKLCRTKTTNGIWRTFDGGKTYDVVRFTIPFWIGQAYFALSPSVVQVAVNCGLQHINDDSPFSVPDQENAVIRSLDNGTTWERVAIWNGPSVTDFKCWDDAHCCALGSSPGYKNDTWDHIGRSPVVHCTNDSWSSSYTTKFIPHMTYLDRAHGGSLEAGVNGSALALVSVDSNSHSFETTDFGWTWVEIAETIPSSSLSYPGGGLHCTPHLRFCVANVGVGADGATMALNRSV